jgi:outer membrane protein
VNQVGNIFSVISLIGVVVLFFMMPDRAEVEETATNAAEQEIAESDSGKADASTKVAFIKVDSLMKYYKKADELREELNQSRIKFDSELSSKQKKLMSDAESFRIRAATMSNFEAQQRQKELLEREQQLMQLEQNYGQRLAYTEAGFSKEITDSLNAFLADFVKGKSYDVILSDNQTGAVLWGNPGIDITQEVIEGLNARLGPADSTKPAE